MESRIEDQIANRADQFAFGLNHITEFQELIRFADTKAGAAVTVASALLTVLLAAFGSVHSALALLPTSWQFWVSVIVLLLSACFFLAFMFVLYYAFLTFLPRLRNPDHPPTVAFFGDVHAMGEAKFIHEVSSMSTEVLLEHVLRQVFLLSEIVEKKFKAQATCFRGLRFVLLFWSLAQIGILILPQC